MKIRATGAMVIGAVVLAACASATSSPVTGAGGHNTTVTVSHSASSSSSSSGSTGGSAAGGCSAPASDSDCASCADYATCEMCEEGLHPSGAMLLNTLLECVLCTACYTVCEGSTNGCTMAPATKDACDTGTPSAPGGGACGSGTAGCIACSQKAGGTCNADNMACGASADCKAFDTALQACPQN